MHRSRAHAQERRPFLSRGTHSEAGRTAPNRTGRANLERPDGYAHDLLPRHGLIAMFGALLETLTGELISVDSAAASTSARLMSGSCFYVIGSGGIPNWVAMLPDA